MYHDGGALELINRLACVCTLALNKSFVIETYGGGFGKLHPVCHGDHYRELSCL